MTVDEWDEIMQWVNDRYPKSWTAEQALAYFDDLAKIDVEHVWAGLYAIYEKGTGFAPNGSQLLAEAISQRRRAAFEDRYQHRGLPEPVQDRSKTWSSFVEQRFGEELAPRDVLVRLHTERTDCHSPTCDIHNSSSE